MRAKYIGETDPLTLENGTVYEIVEVSPKTGWYRVMCDLIGEDYLFPPEDFVIVED